MSKGNLAIVVIVIVLIAVGIFLWLQDGGGPSGEVEDKGTTTVPQASLGEDIFSQVESGNPAEDLPEVNPFSEGKTNPLKNTYKNPFE